MNGNPLPLRVLRCSRPETACEGELRPEGFRSIASIKYPESDVPTVNTYGTDRVLKQTTSTGETWQFAYRRLGACVAKVLPEPVTSGGTTKTWEYTCRAGQPLSSRTCSGGTCTEAITGTCPDIDSDESRQAGWRFYGGSNIETVVTRPDGGLTRQKFNARGLGTEEVDPLGQSTRFAYDTRQRLVRSIDPLGREMQYEYDGLGNRTAQIDALGHRVETAYDPAGNKPSEITRFWLEKPSVQNGQQLSYTPLVRSMTYDGRGNLTATRDETGLSGQMSYDSLGQLVTVTLPVRLGATGVPIVSAGVPGTVPPDQRKTILGYNTAGDLILVTDAQGNETRFATDALGRTIGSTDPLGYSSQQQYNELNQPTESTDALAQKSSLTYDTAGRLTGVINAANVTIESYGHDDKGRVERVTDALNRSTSIEYDSSSRPFRITDRKGQVTTLAYDPRGNIRQLDKPGRSISFTYDAVGRLAEVRDGSSVNTWQYDAADRVVRVDSTTAAGSHRLAYEYDSLDRVTKRTLTGTGIASAEVTAFEWDAADRILSHTTNAGGQPHQTRYEYDVAGRLAARKVQAGDQQDLITQRYGYDSVERLAQIKYVKAEGTSSEQLIEQIDYGYDANGRRISKTTLNNNGTGASETPMSATYDAANRMTGVTLTIAGTTKTYTLTYDQNGNLTEKTNTADAADKTTYTWDADNRLTGISQPGLNASFAYDAFGRRIQASITKADQAPATVQYLYEGSQALGEIRGGRLTHRLLTGLSLDETIARIAITQAGQKDGAGSRIYLTDALNSVIAQVTDEANSSIANSYGYSPYGETQVIGPDATSNSIQYTSRENDGTALYFYRARYYDPVLKRFVSSDPIGLAGGLNTYSYVQGMPTQFTDPTGLLAFGPRSGQSTPDSQDSNACKPPIDKVDPPLCEGKEGVELCDCEYRKKVILECRGGLDTKCVLKARIDQLKCIGDNVK